MRPAPTTIVAVAGLLAVLAPAGCVRQVLSGTDPDLRVPTISTNTKRNEVVVDIPWMQIPAPRLLYEDQLTRSEVVFARSPDKVTHFTLRSVAGTVAQVDVRTRLLADDSYEMAYEVIKLPPKYSVDVVIPVLADGSRPSCDVKVNGAPVAITPGTEVVAVVLARDSATRILAVPHLPPPVATPSAAPAGAATPAAAAPPASK